MFVSLNLATPKSNQNNQNTSFGYNWSKATGLHREAVHKGKAVAETAEDIFNLISKDASKALEKEGVVTTTIERIKTTKGSSSNTLKNTLAKAISRFQSSIRNDKSKTSLFHQYGRKLKEVEEL